MNYAKLCKENKVALQFSGGKDSLVLLHAMKPYWNDLVVYYCNSGDSFPETDSLIAYVKTIVPNFIEVQGRKPLVEEYLGWSSDVVTSGSTDIGIAVGSNEMKLVDRYTCCFKSLMEPLHEQMQKDGIQVILRGQRSADKLKSPVIDGELIGGFRIFYPINTLTDADVFAYLEKHNIPIPRFYSEGMTSGGDCMHCTAWLEHGQAKYIKKYHADEAKIVFHRLEQIQKAISDSYERLEKLLEVST